MDLPTTSREAADLVVDTAHRLKQSVTAYCLERGVNPSIISNWQKRDGDYSGSVLAALLKGSEKKRLEDKQKTGKLRK